VKIASTKKFWRIVRWQLKKRWLVLKHTITTNRPLGAPKERDTSDQDETRELSLLDMAKITHNMHAAAAYEQRLIENLKTINALEKQRFITESNTQIRLETKKLYEWFHQTPASEKIAGRVVMTLGVLIIGMLIIAIMFGSELVVRTKTSDAAPLSNGLASTMSRTEQSLQKSAVPPAAVPVRVATPPASAAMIYRVRAARNQSVADANTEFGCKSGTLATYNKLTTKSIPAGNVFWIPGDECSYNGKSAKKHAEAILTYTVPPSTTALTALATTYDCRIALLKAYYQKTNPKGDANNLRTGEVVYLPDTICSKLP
jgi:hypothetical protein